MNNEELCIRIREKAMKETNNFLDFTKASIIEKIVAHFGLAAPKIQNNFYIEREKSIRDILNFLNNDATESDRIWIINHIEEPVFSEIICELSPKFIATFKEAKQAYNEGLTLICGNGFRKAAEYLIYDFAVKRTNDEESVKYKITSTGKKKEKTFSERIEEYLKNAPDAKDLANAARKLGNNFTHIIEIEDENYTLEWLMAFVELLTSDIEELINPCVTINQKIRDKAKEILNKNQ